MREGALVFECGPPCGLVADPDSVEAVHQYCRIYERPFVTGLRAWRGRFEDIEFILRGHFYCRSGSSFDVHENAAILAKNYQQEQDIAALKREIAGGIFVLFILDRKRDRLHVLTDRLACMPVFLACANGSVVITTNQFVFDGSHPLSQAAVTEYLRYGYLSFAHSLFEGVSRLQPGDSIEISLADPALAETRSEGLRSYVPLSEQIDNLDEATDCLIKALDRFFSRVGTESYAAGLSGGYDSRVIAAYLAPKNTQFVTFGAPASEETLIAKAVAHALGTRTICFDIRVGAPRLHALRFRQAMQTTDSLESSHVFELLAMLERCDPDYLADGFLGGEVVGSHYYYKLVGGADPFPMALLLRDSYHKPVQESRVYLKIVREAFGRAVRVAELNAAEVLYTDEQESSLLSAIEEQVGKCHSHADMIELLRYRFRSRALIACGPIAFSSSRPVLCPFYDNDVFDVCLRVSKRLRAGDRLYNAFWRRRFPELSRIPKESTGGCAANGDLRYRVRHFRKALARRFADEVQRRVPFRGAGGDNSGALVSAYCRLDCNRTFFNRVAEAVEHKFPDPIRDGIVERGRTGRLGDILYIRLASLMLLLADEPALVEIVATEDAPN